MIRFDFTDNYVQTCRDCKDNMKCRFTKGGTILNNLSCLEAKFEPRIPKATDAISDYYNLKRQITIMLCGIESTKNQFMLEDQMPSSLKSECFKRQHTYTEYCKFETALKKFHKFLTENEEYKDNDSFVEDMIRTVIILEDNGKVEVNTYNKSLKNYMRNN